MTRSHLPILLSSVLLLGAASPNPRPIPNPRPTESSQIHQHHQETHNDYPIASPAPSPIDQPYSPSPEKVTSDSNSQIQSELITIEGRIANFTLLLVLVGALQFFASLFAACAARSSARAASLALKSDRPYLLLDMAQLFGLPPKIPPSVETWDNAITEAKISFKNYGRGPALIENIIVKLKVVAELPAPKDFSECTEWKATVDAVPPAAGLVFTTGSRDAMISDSEIDSVLKKARTLIVYGRVQYKDVFETQYETGFFWVAFIFDNLRLIGSPMEAFLTRDHKDPNDKERNYHT